jgi:hypothetical protein
MFKVFSMLISVKVNSYYSRIINKKKDNFDICV